jgi:peptidoglycan/LPS O-acetylase OafA/YrhL
MTLPQPQAITEKTTQRPRRFVHIRELDGIRGIAALMVFFHHVCFASIQATGWARPIALIYALSGPGRYGVDLFFVLSGFLITSLLIDAREQPSYFHDFYWKRVLRILPVYILCLLGILLFIPGSWSFVLLSALFLANFSGIFHIGASGPFWTLAIEEQFYLIWPTVVRRRPVEQVRRWAIAIGASAFVLRLAVAAFGHWDYYFTFFRCDGLAFGAFLACWYYQRDQAHANRALENRLTATAFLLGALLFALPVPNSNLAVAFWAAFQQTGVTLLCGSTVAYVVVHSGSRSLAPLRSAILTFFGLISYALYMFHAYIMDEYDRERGALASGDTGAWAIRLLSILLISIAACLLSRYLIELPAMSLRRFVLAKPAPPSPEEPPLPLGNM